ncbi:hypothetical protein PLEOSDRAFT_153867 [Pleurotus ostreatus PC15]|uniref:Uncharacterized protein n=1 Tax=Pleurotus ostreatus (strain PC15) TaxID=1137138 RepID=A0A067NUN4_PLEO1|nr:hypothetical protein PLEOSDRAFT_153867 [Pleurotus ostreatus PC15]
MNTTTNPFARSDSSQIISFAFSSSILNSHLLGPDRQPYYRVFTDSFGDATHILSQGREIACIRWAAKSIKLSSMAGGADGTPISEWIAKSPNPGATGLRYMSFDGVKYACIRKDNRYSLYTSLKMGATPVWMARIINGEGGAVRVELFADSIWRGLLDPCVIAAVLLFSGRDID